MTLLKTLLKFSFTLLLQRRRGMVMVTNVEVDYLNGTILFIGTHHGPEELQEGNADELMTLEKGNEGRIQKTFQGVVDKDLKGTWA
ncbi:hypothetical protein V1525DRAFT_387229 [Lipomyces kononenkoae]|uniref:Uncharacterized protein n=1 Tax=Lipomyces kononenkoae TaxID=34357 RepID=A0ACC3T4I2_LIPKO